MKNLRLLLTFYQSFALVGILIDVSCTIILYTWGIATFKYLFWFKVVTLLLTYLWVNDNKAIEFIYYKNLGLERRQLWWGAAAIETFLFALAVAVIVQMR
jgi:hypothetical protein